MILFLNNTQPMFFFFCFIYWGEKDKVNGNLKLIDVRTGNIFHRWQAKFKQNKHFNKAIHYNYF